MSYSISSEWLCFFLKDDVGFLCPTPFPSSTGHSAHGRFERGLASVSRCRTVLSFKGDNITSASISCMGWCKPSPRKWSFGKF